MVYGVKHKISARSADNFLPLTAPTHPSVNAKRWEQIFAPAASTKGRKKLYMSAPTP